MRNIRQNEFMLGWHSGDCASFVMRNYQGFESLTQLQLPLCPNVLISSSPHASALVVRRFRNVGFSNAMRRGVVSTQVRGWRRTYTRSTASLALKDVPIGVRCGIVLGVKTPSFDGRVERRSHLFLSSRQTTTI